MKRAQIMLVSALLAVSTLGATAQAASAYRADVWSNSNSFTSRCLGFTDTYPQELYLVARSGMASLGYGTVGGALGSSFTRTAFLRNVYADYAVYVHSHGDNYWASSGTGIDSAVLADPGTTRCSDRYTDAIRSSAIKAATLGTFYNLVIMSTCRLGSSVSTMPDAFQIERVKNSSQHEFYLGYVYLTYDSAQLRFERAFWSYLAAGAASPEGKSRPSLYQAFIYASSIGGYEAPDSANPFAANWWGNPSYDGRPG